MSETIQTQNSQMSSVDLIRIKIEAVEALVNVLESGYQNASSAYEMYVIANTWLNAMKSMLPND